MPTYKMSRKMIRLKLNDREGVGRGVREERATERQRERKKEKEKRN